MLCKYNVCNVYLSQSGETALLLASRGSRLDIMKLLLNSGADPNIPFKVTVSFTVICMCVLYRDPQVKMVLFMYACHYSVFFHLSLLANFNPKCILLM